jgi:hypothetical protein
MKLDSLLTKAERLKKIDWKRLSLYVNPQSVKDFDVFLDKLPKRVGITGLGIACGIWAVAGLSLLVAYTKSVNLQDVRRLLTQAEAMRPSVPTISYKPVPDAQITPQIEKMKDVYKTLTISMSNGTITIAASSTRDFPVWRAAIGDLSFGGNAWRVQTTSLCAGKECKGQPLQASLAVQQLDISVPTTTKQQQEGEPND